MVETQSKARIVPWGWTLSTFLLITYLLCAGLRLTMPTYYPMHQAWGQMHAGWAPMMQGYGWLSLPGFLGGAVASFAFGWYAAALLVPLYNYFNGRAG